jgi:hypothetical protein
VLIEPAKRKRHSFIFFDDWYLPPMSALGR